MWSALISVLIKIVDLYWKTPAEKREQFLRELPTKLREWHAELDKAVDEDDPARLNRIVNGG